MIVVPCPWCGPRNAEEFRFVGDVQARPVPATATPEEWRPTSTSAERGRLGDRDLVPPVRLPRYFVVERHRVTNEIRASRPPRAQARRAES